jgi:hypothetical protein
VLVGAGAGDRAGRHWSSSAAARRRFHSRNAAIKSARKTRAASSAALSSHQSRAGGVVFCGSPGAAFVGSRVALAVSDAAFVGSDASTGSDAALAGSDAAFAGCDAALTGLDAAFAGWDVEGVADACGVPLDAATRSAVSCARISCCMRSTIAVSSTMRWRNTCVSASITAACSCCAFSRSAAVAPRRATAAVAPLDNESRGAPAAAAGGRFGAVFATARLFGGVLLRVVSEPSAGAAGAPSDAVRVEGRTAGRTGRFDSRAAGAGRGATTASRGAVSAATTGVSIAGGSMNNVNSRRTADSQPACIVRRTTGSFTAADW